MAKAGALRKRYILFRFVGPDWTEEQLKRGLYEEALRFFGELGLSHAALKLVSYDPKEKTGAIRCERGYLESVLGFLALVGSLSGSEARLVAVKSSGTLKSLGRELASTHSR